MLKYKQAFMLKTLTFLIGTMLPMSIFAQQISLRGEVKDVDGEPIIGASVMIKGTTEGTITDVDGKFTLDLKRGETLIVSSISYVGIVI